MPNKDQITEKQEIENIEEIKEDIEEQYRILKDEEEQEERRKSFLLIVLFLLIFSISFTGATFSYLGYKNAKNNQGNTSIEEGNQDNTDDKRELVILYNAGTEFIAEDVKPGWESTASKDFSVKNTGNLNAEYDVVFTNIRNTFTNLNELKYSIKCNDVFILENQPVPATETIVLNKQTVKAGETNNYEIFFKFEETNQNQNNNSGKSYKVAIDVTTAK